MIIVLGSNVVSFFFQPKESLQEGKALSIDSHVETLGVINRLLSDIKYDDIYTFNSDGHINNLSEPATNPKTGANLNIEFDNLPLNKTIIVATDVSGVEQAKLVNPKLRVIGITNANTYKEPHQQAGSLRGAGADIVVSNIRDLPAALEWLDSGLHFENRSNFKSDIWYDTSHNPPEREVGGKPQGRKLH